MGKNRVHKHTPSPEVIQKAERIAASLEEYHAELQANSELKRLVPFVLRKSGETDQKRMGHLFEYEGTDETTRSLLEERETEWLERPNRFVQPFHRDVSKPLLYTLQIVNSAASDEAQSQMARRITCLAVARFAARHKGSRMTEKEFLKKQVEYESLNKEQLKTLLKCYEHATKYMNLEEMFHPGLTLVLGVGMRKTYWTKLLPKTGPKPDLVRERLESIGMRDICYRYAALQETLLSHLVNHMTTLQSTTVSNMYSSESNGSSGTSMAMEDDQAMSGAVDPLDEAALDLGPYFDIDGLIADQDWLAVPLELRSHID